MTIDFSGFAFPKQTPKVVDRLAKKAAADKEERLAKAKVWKRAESKCERCLRPVEKSVDSLKRGEVHHKTFRSKGGTWDIDNLELTCALCHAGIHTRRKQR